MITKNLENQDPGHMKKLDYALLILFPAIAFLAIFGLKLNYFWTVSLLFGLPAFWLSLRAPKMIARAALFSVALTVPFGIVMNYIGVHDGSWYVPTTFFPFRLLGVLPVEDIMGCFLLIYEVIICYEHFLGKNKYNLIDKKMKYFIWPFSLLSIVFFTLLATHTEFPKIKYVYFWIGIIFSVLPIIGMVLIFPKRLLNFWKIGLYFTILMAIFEYAGLYLNQWVFQGNNFIGWVSYFGYKIPIEELVFFDILFIISIFAYYEFFNDEKK
jgi:hypothetical protein